MLTSTRPTHQRPTYNRKVSRIERGYLNAATQGTHQLIQTVVEGHGRIDPDRLREAVQIATAACPGLAVHRRGPVWRGGGPVPPVLEIPGWDADTELLHHDIDVVTGPIAEIVIDAGEVTRLVVRASHIVTDGRGLQHWMADVFRVLRGEEPIGAPATVDDTHFRTAAGPVPDAPPPTRTKGATLMLGAGPAEERPLWTRRLVAGTPTAGTARIAAAISRHLPEETGRIVVPVDLRRHDRSVASTANLTAQLLIDITRDDSWRRVHGDILKSLMRKREVAQLGGDFLRDNPFANSLAEAQGRDPERFPCTAIISDHGPVDLARFTVPADHGAGFEPTSFHTLPMLVPYAEMFVSSCQTPAGTELTLSCRRRPGARAAADAVLDDIEALLTDA